MDGLCNTAPLCTHCQGNPRLPGQRWCRQCLTAAQRDRRAAQRATQVDEAPTPVTHAEIQGMPSVTRGDAQAPAPVVPTAEQGLADVLQAVLAPRAVPQVGASAGVTPAQRQALEAYRIALQEQMARQQMPRQGWHHDRTSILVQVQGRVAWARERLAALGISNPEQALRDHLRGG